MKHASVFSAGNLSHSCAIIISIGTPTPRHMGPEHNKDRKNAVNFGPRANAVEIRKRQSCRGDIGGGV